MATTTRHNRRLGAASWLAAVTALLSSLPLSSGMIEPRAPGWPNGPLTTSGRWITDTTGAKVTYVGANWPGSLETMIPEGLQYQSVKVIVAQLKSLGMNSVRLTYAIEMVDQYYDNGEKDITVRDAFVDALGKEDGSAIYDKVVANNPSFGPETTRLQVYDAIAEECAKQEIYVHLDNHVSKAGWCCSPLDGNSWWGDTYFDVGNWTRGLSFMAEHGKTWPSLTSMSLRNELRVSLTINELVSSYTWTTWYEHMRQGADAVHAANSDVLIFLSGLDSDRDLGPIVRQGEALPGPRRASKDDDKIVFNTTDFRGYGDDKLVLELHVYDNIVSAPPSDCAVVTNALVDNGFKTLATVDDARAEGDEGAVNTFPLVVTEFGFPQNSTVDRNPYASCLLDYFTEQHAGWMVWVLGGSYYVREGSLDRDEEWGLLSHDWSSWRSSNFVNDLLKPAVKTSLAPIPDDNDNGDNDSADPSHDSSGDTPDDAPDDVPDDKPSTASIAGQGPVGVAFMLAILVSAVMGSVCL